MRGGNLQRRRRALTLLEVLLSVVLISGLLAALLAFFNRALQVRDLATKELDRNKIARQMLDTIAEELRCAIGMDEVGFPVEQRLVGDRRSITFLTTRLPSREQFNFVDPLDEQPPARADLTQLTYLLWIDEEETTDEGEPLVGGILREEKSTLNQFVIEENDEDNPFQIRRDLWAPELGYLEFRYFDGVEWTTTWEVTEGNSLPQMIQITVGFDSITEAELLDEDLDFFPLEDYPLGPDEPHPDRYSVLVRIPAADRFFGSRVQRMNQEINEMMGVEGEGF